MKKKKSLKFKLLSAFMVMATVVLAVGGVAYYTFENVVKKYDHIEEINLPNAVNLAILRGSSKDIYRLLIRLESLSNQEDHQRVYKELDEIFAKYDKTDKIYQGIEFVEGEAELYDAQKSQWLANLKIKDRLLELARIGTAEAKDEYERVLANEYRPAFHQYEKKLQALIDFQNAEAEKWSEQADSAYQAGALMIFALVAIGFLLAVIIGAVFSQTLSKTLREMANQLSDEATEVANASHQVSEASNELSASATEQASALQETVSSLDEVNAMVSKNADNANRSLEMSENSRKAADRGKTAVDDMIHSIEEISSSNAHIMQQIEASNQEISNIVKVISEIGEKTKVINDIVFQTKLLSFNASVEAARAGEHGKGFAVVAEEVGNLAQMSGNAAQEISQMLEESIEKVERIVNETKSRVEGLVATGKEKVESGTVTARRCGEILDEMVTQVDQVNQMINEIATASNEQSQGVQEISKAMNQLDQVTQQNASASQQSSAASNQLQSQAETLRSIVRTLSVLVEGGAETTTQPEHQAERFASNVVSFEKKKAEREEKEAASQEEANSRQKQEQKSASSREGAQKVSGSDVLPEDDDPRWQDI